MLICSNVSCAFSPIFALSLSFTHLNNLKQFLTAYEYTAFRYSSRFIDDRILSITLPPFCLVRKIVEIEEECNLCALA